LPIEFEVERASEAISTLRRREKYVRFEVFHCGDYEECRLLVYNDAVWFLRTDVWDERIASIFRLSFPSVMR
jgi:hypothetical protein